MTTLLISPDYASHYFGLATLGRERQRRGGRVIVATGPALRARVRADGFEHVELVLGPGHNEGLARADRQPGAEGDRLRAFFAATRRGMTATLAHQVRARGHAMLWEPESVTRRLGAILADIRPRHVIVDQLAFGATLALRALEHPFVSFLPSHPCQLPRLGDPDGFPLRFPRELEPPEAELAALRALCEAETRRFIERYNTTLALLNAAAAPAAAAVSPGSPQLTLIAYPHELAPGAARPGVALVGAVVRSETADAELARALARRRAGQPTVYVSLGTFLSAREDVLATIAAALRALEVNVVLSSGVADPARLGPLPAHWHVRSSLPQVAALSACDAVICHGGNNTVMEALSTGCRSWPAPSPPISSSRPRTCAATGWATRSIPTGPARRRSPPGSVTCWRERPASGRARSVSGCERGPGRSWPGT